MAVLFSVLQCNEGAEVYVNAKNGSDTECFSLQDLSSMNDTSMDRSLNAPCRTINHALGNVECSSSCENANPLFNSVLKLSDGTHKLQSCIGILQGENITIEADNHGEATIRCVSFRNKKMADNIQSCMTKGLVFRGINFEGCGPLSPNVFINRSTDVLFEDCTFK